jgi:hypothetical protein
MVLYLLINNGDTLPDIALYLGFLHTRDNDGAQLRQTIVAY